MSDLSIQINRSKFYSALQTASRAISPNSPVPALSGIKIEVANEEMVLTASNADISLEIKLSNAIDEGLQLHVFNEGVIVVEAKSLVDMVNHLSSEVISMSVMDGTLTSLSDEEGEYRFAGYRAADYPTLDFSKPTDSFTIAYKEFAAMINETSFAASVKETRPVLTGINLNSSGDRIVCTATDSYRLARKILPLSTAVFNITIPAKSLNEAKAIFADQEELELAVSSKKVQFIGENVRMQTRLLEGAYPETDRLIPTSFSSVLVINRQYLLSTLSRALFRTDNMPIIRFKMNDTSDIQLENKSTESASYKGGNVKAISYEGMPMNISFAGNYVNDAAKNLSGETITIRFTGEMKPFILTNSEEDDSILQLVLPVRTYN